MVVIGGFAALFALKAYIVKRKFNRQLDDFVHPSYFM